jgi:hypothetical protein
MRDARAPDANFAAHNAHLENPVNKLASRWLNSYKRARKVEHSYNLSFQTCSNSALSNFGI